MSAIILDSHLKSALSVIRSLGERGIEVACGSDRKSAMGFASKYCSSYFVYPSPVENPDDFIKELIGQADKSKDEPPVLFTFSDPTTLLVSRSREILERKFKILMPPKESVEKSFDKSETLILAESIGVPVPKTKRINSAIELDALDFKLPVVAKTRTNYFWSGRQGIKTPVRIFADKEKLRKYCLEVHSKTGSFPLLQEYIKGEEFGLEFLVLDGSIKAGCAHRRIRSISPSGGASVVKMTIETPPETLKMALELLKKLNWAGPAMVEFKVDSRTGKPCLMEINGRFWGSLPLAIHAGVDFPALMYDRVYPLNQKLKNKCKTGVVSRHLAGDIKWLLDVMFKNDPLRNELYPARSSALRSFLKDLADPSIENDVFSWKDPKPFFAEIFQILNK